MTHTKRFCDVWQAKDIDILSKEDDDEQKGSGANKRVESSLTWKNLANVLDAVVSLDATIIVLLTSNVDTLNAALLHRVDKTFALRAPGKRQFQRLFQSFYPQTSRDTAVRFAEYIMQHKAEHARSFNALEKHFVATRKLSAKQCLDNLGNFLGSYAPLGRDFEEIVIGNPPGSPASSARSYKRKPVARDHSRSRSPSPPPPPRSNCTDTMFT